MLCSFHQVRPRQEIAFDFVHALLLFGGRIVEPLMRLNRLAVLLPVRVVLEASEQSDAAIPDHLAALKCRPLRPQIAGGEVPELRGGDAEVLTRLGNDGD
jgi:hypothetical protein